MALFAILACLDSIEGFRNLDLTAKLPNLATFEIDFSVVVIGFVVVVIVYKGIQEWFCFFFFLSTCSKSSGTGTQEVVTTRAPCIFFHYTSLTFCLLSQYLSH